LLGVPDHEFQIGEPASSRMAAYAALRHVGANRVLIAAQRQSQEAAAESASVFRASLREAQLAGPTTSAVSPRGSLPGQKAREVDRIRATPRSHRLDFSLFL